MWDLQNQNPSLSADIPVAWDAPVRPAPERQRAERRKTAARDPNALRAGLTPGQLRTLDTLEQFQWILHFVRRPLFQAPIPVLFNRDASKFVVILEDGAIDEQPLLKLRG